MIKIKAIISLLMILPYALSVLNGRCSQNGICINEATCNAYGGYTVSGLCPYDSNSIKCCFNMNCRPAAGKNGKCGFVNDCKKGVYNNLCPGGTDFKCCAWACSLSSIEINKLIKNKIINYYGN